MQNTSSELGEDVQELLSWLKETIWFIVENKPVLEESKEECDSCATLRKTVALLVSAIIKQTEQTKRFEGKLKEKEEAINNQAEQLVKMEKDLYTDSLTRVNNRNKYEQDLRELKEWFDKGFPFTYSLLDIDFFKKVNDTFGHKVGDAVLIKFASGISDIIADLNLSCSVYRIGWEEFVIMGALNKKELVELVEEVRNFFNWIDYIVTNKGDKSQRRIKIQFSAWLSEFKSSSTISSIYEETDALLYLSKQNGRNRTTCECEKEEKIC